MAFHQDRPDLDRRHKIAEDLNEDKVSVACTLGSVVWPALSTVRTACCSEVGAKVLAWRWLNDQLVGDRLTGASLYYLGDLPGARRHIECVLADSVTPGHRSHTILFQLDPRVTARVFNCTDPVVAGICRIKRRTLPEISIEDVRMTGRAISPLFTSGVAPCLIALQWRFGHDEHYMGMLLDRSARHALPLYARQAVVIEQCSSSSARSHHGIIAATHLGRRNRPYAVCIPQNVVGKTLSAALGDADRSPRTCRDRGALITRPSAPKNAGSLPSCCALRAAYCCKARPQRGDGRGSLPAGARLGTAARCPLLGTARVQALPGCWRSGPTCDAISSASARPVYRRFRLGSRSQSGKSASRRAREAANSAKKVVNFPRASSRTWVRIKPAN